MHLRDYLIQTDNATASAADVRAGLAETVEISRNSTRQTITDVAKALGFAATIAMVERLKANGFDTFVTVVTAGCRFDDAETIAAIDAAVAAGAVTAEEAATVKAMGITTGPAWRKWSLPELPSVEEIEAAQATIASDALAEQVAQRYQSVRDAMAAGEVLTWEQARAALGAE